ncbi:MAG TPA: helix-turn-helix domain-containing protein [Candidatus Dormibacteraeota bacterium]|jgi:AcrR family transcriptional regulator
MNARTEVKREYRSELRQAQAASTRRAVIEAAGHLFAERGYVATSIEDIAALAGVSRATVFTAVGGKPLLLKTAYEVAIVGDDEPVALVERPRSQMIRAEPDVRRYLDLYAGLVTGMQGRLASIAEAARGAAGADADARRLWEDQQAQRRRGSATVVADVRRKGRLRRGLTAEIAADIVWVHNDPCLYHQLVQKRGWTPRRFQAWLARSLKEQLLG